MTSHATLKPSELFSVLVAKTVGAKQLALFHHDPAHDDAFVDQLLDQARCLGAIANVDVVAAYEGLSLQLGDA